MEITVIGCILIPLGIWLYLSSPARLYPLTVFSIFFSATAVINVGSGDSYSGIQATMFFGTLWMFSEISEMRRRRDNDPRSEINRSIRRLLIFLGAVVLSLVMPVWISRGVTIVSPEFGNPESRVLQFTFGHITQTMYVVYGVSLAIFAARKNSDRVQFLRTLRTLSMSAIFISLWAFFQFFCNLLGINYPAYIFNTSKAGSAMGYAQELTDIGVQRISSVTTEPSVLAACLLVAAVFVLFAVMATRPLISRTWDRFALLAIFGALIISTSTTGYIGMAVICLLSIPALLSVGIFRPAHVIVLGTFAAALGVFYVSSSSAQDVIASMLLGKGETYSAMSRLLSVLLARDYFLQYPILGLGWGSVTSDDLLFKLLSNVGVVGFLAFSVFVITVFNSLWRAARAMRPKGIDSSLPPVMMLVAFVLLIFTNATSGFVYAYSHVWFVFGLAMAVPAFCISSKVSKVCPPFMAPSPAVTA